MKKMTWTNYTDANVAVKANGKADYYVYNSEVIHYGT